MFAGNVTYDYNTPINIRILSSLYTSEIYNQLQAIFTAVAGVKVNNLDILHRCIDDCRKWFLIIIFPY